MIWLVHESNIEGKVRTNYKRLGEQIADFKTNQYLPYKQQQMQITEITEEAIVRKTELYERYSRVVDRFIERTGNVITAQSKFRPTVLEEFCGYLFKDLPILQTLGLSFFKKSVYAGIRIDRNGNAELETKDVDFCIGKEVSATFADNLYTLRIPVVAIECKTYLDKTMLMEAQFTAQKLKGGTPRVKVFVVMETNSVKLTEIPTETPIDQMYVLRHTTDDPIDPDTVWALFDEVKTAIEHIPSREEIRLPGKLLV